MKIIYVQIFTGKTSVRRFDNVEHFLTDFDIERLFIETHPDTYDQILTSATIPWVDDQGSLREWRPVAVKSPLPADAHRDTPVFIDVVMPPDTRQGYMILKKIHRITGMKSAAQWNAYHVACYLWDKFGTWDGKMSDPTKPVERRDKQNRLVDGSGKTLVTQRGKEIKNLYHKEAVKQLDRETNFESVKKYPVLSWDDLLNACCPNGYSENNKGIYLKRAKEHWEKLEADGYVIIVKERAGWRILPPKEHLNAHRSLRTAQQLNLTDPTSLQGMRVLKQLLFVLTPKETTLLPNYPNPFNPETWIPYHLADPADVTLMIYDAEGKVVRKLSLEHQNAGIYQSRNRAAQWDGKNEIGELVASGVYFYTITAGDFTATRKMIIRK